MTQCKRLAVVGFDSISLPFLDTFVQRGVMPNVKRLMDTGCTTQTWPCYPMETATNWACLATGATPAVHGCNMAMPEPGGPVRRAIQAFPGDYCKAEQLWTAAQRAGKQSIIFDWTQSWPLPNADRIFHVGEDGRPHNAIRALQEVCAYTSNPGIPESFHVRRVAVVPARGWSNAPAGALEFEMPVTPTAGGRFGGPGLTYEYAGVSGLIARIDRGPEGYDSVAVFASRAAAEPLFRVRLGEWSDWALHTFTADGEQIRAHVRGKLLELSPDGQRVHLYLSEIYPADGFSVPAELAGELTDVCGPYVIQCSRQQVVIGNASDITTYFEEQQYMGEWYRKAAGHLLGTRDWDLFMFKWHGPDWTNHLTMYMIDDEHAMYDPARAEEGWGYWDRLMGLGDRIVGTVIEAAGPDAAVALVSDHGGSTNYGGRHPNTAAQVVQDLGLQDKAWALHHYVYVNTTDRFTNGTVEPESAEFHSIRDALMEALLDAKDEHGRHAYRSVLPMEDAARLGVAGSFAGDIFIVPAPPHKPTKAEFMAAHPPEKRGTWDWPKLNSGGHSDDSYFILSGPGIRQGYRRSSPTRITSVAPTLASALGIPVPRDADGTVLQDFLEACRAKE